MKLNQAQKEMMKSYLRSVIGAVAAVASTGNYEPDDLLKAVVAALIPPVLRWVNSSDPAFGRTKQ